MGKRGKRGQISIFIIVGAVILIAVAIFLFIRSKEDKVGDSFQEAITRDVPQEMLPITSYIDKCLLEVSEDGAKLIGLQGGYAYPRESGVRSAPGRPLDGNALDVPMTGHDVPYWHYLYSPNDCPTQNCMFSTEMPYLRKSDGAPSIEKELEKYITRNIGSCLNDLNIFREKGWEITVKEQPWAEVQVTGDDVLVLLHYQFRAQMLETSEHNVETFVIRLPVPLQKMYTQAFLIAYLERSTNFLEHHTMNIVSAFDYEGEDGDRLPSIAHTEMAFGSMETWSEFKVEQQLKQLLETYIPWLQVNGSTSEQQRSHANAGVQAMIYNGMLIPGDQSVEGLDVSFQYYKDLWAPIYLDVCDGGLCQPRMAGITFPAAFGVSLYSFDYDISYPVLIEVYDEKALGDEGYTFYFALETNVRNNKPLAANLSTTMLNIDDSDSHVSDLFCISRTSGNITINVKNSLGQPVEEAAITYQSADTTCPIGMTNATGSWTGKFPASFGGLLGLFKPEHQPYRIHKTINPNDEFTLDITLYEETEVEFRVEGWLMAYDGIEWAPVTDVQYLLHPEDNLMVMFERQTGMGEEDFFQMAELRGNETGTVKLVPGDYTLEAFGIYMDNFDFHDTIDTGSDDVDVDINFNESLPTASVKVDFTVLPAHLQQNKDLVVRVAAVNPYNLDDITDLEKLGEIQGVTELYPSLFQPYWE